MFVVVASNVEATTQTNGLEIARPASSAGLFAAKTDRFRGKQAKQPGMATPLFYV
jgi:hypothetical protein